jgi:hypothetical protein
MGRLWRRLLQWFGFGGRPGWSGRGPRPGSPRDPFAGKLAPVRSGPKNRSGAVAVAEPDE